MYVKVCKIINNSAGDYPDVWMPNNRELVCSHTVAPPCSSILWPPHTQNVLLSGCTQLQPLWRMQIRCIGYRSAVALSSPMLQITFDVRHHYRSDTIQDFLLV